MFSVTNGIFSAYMYMRADGVSELFNTVTLCNTHSK